ncbi:MAG: hypothetical protein AAFY65_14215 [Pseudomonadota bacterium]
MGGWSDTARAQAVCAQGVLALALSVPALAEPGQMVGTWCAGDGTTLTVEWQQLGANEHTICDPATPVRRDQRAWSSALSCRNVYWLGRNADGSDHIQQVAVQDVTGIAARLTADDRLSVRVTGARPWSDTLDRCDG